MIESRPRNRHLTSGRVLARNTVWNLIGSAAPMLVALFCIPVLIHHLGNERFGILTLAWTIIGYASLFDLGLGRALTQLVASKLGCGQDSEIPALVWTSLIAMLLMGCTATVAVALTAPWLNTRGLNIPVALQKESLQSLWLLAICIPFVITTAGLRGLLEARQRFGLVNALRFPMVAFTFAGPLLVLPFSNSLVPVVAILVIARVFGCLAHLFICVRVAPELRSSIVWDRSALRPLIRFGGWMTVSNVISPLMVTMDRFLIGALVSMTAVAYYATPFEVVTKILLIPGAVVSVMFPAFSASFVRDRERTALLFARSTKSLFLAVFPMMLCAIILAEDILRNWVGPDFAAHSYRVLQFLAVGVFMNSLAQAPFALIQGVGRPDLTAMLHLFEFPLYLGILWWLVTTHGIEGAAIAWAARTTLDAGFLFVFAKRFLPQGRSIRPRSFVLPGIGIAVLLTAVSLHTPALKIIFLLGSIVAFFLITWFRVLTPEERSLAQSLR